MSEVAGAGLRAAADAGSQEGGVAASDSRSRPRAATWDEVEPILRELVGVPTQRTAVDEGAYSPAARWVVTFADGTSGFVKVETEPQEDYGIGVEHRVYSTVDAAFVPKLIAYDAGSAGRPRILVSEDLSAAVWGTPLDDAAADALAAALDELAGVTPARGMPEPFLEHVWPKLLGDVERATTTGMLDTEWLARHGDTLVAAEGRAPMSGPHLVHHDLWLQNWCRAARGAVLVDWAGAAVAHIDSCRAWGEAAVRSAGGPRGRVMSGRPEWAAWMAGLSVWFLADPPPWPTPERLLETQRREAAACLRWACEELEIEPPSFAPGIVPAGPWRP